MIKTPSQLPADIGQIPPDHEQIVGMTVLLAVEAQHAGKAILHHFYGCKTIHDIVNVVLTLDETTFAGVVVFGAVAWLLLKRLVSMTVR